MANLAITKSFVSALTGRPDTICDWRLINDRAKDDAILLHGTLDSVYEQLTNYNSLGYGVFINVSEMDNSSRKTYENIVSIRCLVADVDDVLVSQASYEQAINSSHPPHFAVQTSHGKYHLYWLTEQHKDIDFFRTHQKKLSELYKSDKAVSDPTRVLRVPGFNHCKGEPFLVTCWQVRQDWTRYTMSEMTEHLKDIDVVHSNYQRNELGKPELQAPSLEWLSTALNLIDPNTLNYEEWLSTSAAFKQAGWTLTTEEQLKSIWLQWCVKYAQNNPSENEVKWRSFYDTQVGWSRFKYVTNIQAYMSYGSVPVVKECLTAQPVISLWIMWITHSQLTPYSM